MTLRTFVFAVLGIAFLAAGSAPESVPVGAVAPSGHPIVRRGFLGAFFRPQGAPPFGVFAPGAKQTAPSPYPVPRRELFGPAGYCDELASNGVSISTGYPLDAAKLSNIENLHVRWTRTPAPQFFDDRSHIEGAGKYQFGDFDAAQCALLRHSVVPLIAMEAGPVEYDGVPGAFSPTTRPNYATAEQFAAWCGAVAMHEKRAFRSVSRFSLPGNEVNSNPQLFPGGDAQIASYSEACYRAIKRAYPEAFVYGFELNMDGNLNPAAFVQRMYALGCRRGTCYDGISIHLSLRYPIPSASTPCYPHPGGDYSMRCIADIQTAARAPVHVIIGETGYVVPGSVPSEAAKADATVAEFEAFARDPYVDGASYANVDECGLYQSGYFINGCLIDVHGDRLPAFDALSRLAQRDFE